MATENSKTVTAEKLKDYRDQLQKSIEVTEAAENVSTTNKDSCELRKTDAENCFSWAKGGFDKYKLLNLGSTMAYECQSDSGASPTKNPKNKSTNSTDPSNKDTENAGKIGVSQMEKDASEGLVLIKDLKDMYKKALDEKLAASLKGIKSLGEKVKSINEAFCKVEAEIWNNCNNSQLEVLKTSISKGKISKDECDIESQKGDTEFEKWISLLCNQVKEVVGKINHIDDYGVQVASANATVDFGNLVIVGQTMESSFKSLKDNVLNTFGFFEEEAKRESGEVVEGNLCTSQYWFDLQENKLKLQAFYNSCVFVLNPQCPPNHGKDDGSNFDWNVFKNNVKELIDCGVSTTPTPTKVSTNPPGSKGN